MAEPNRGRPRGGALTVALGLAVVTSLLPLARVVAPAAWTWAALASIVLILGVGWLLRRLRLPAVAVTGVEAVVTVVWLTLLFASDTALLGVIPTPASFRMIPGAVEGAFEEIIVGAAPLQAGADLAFLIVAACAVLTVAMDHVVLTARVPLLASVALIAVFLIPALAVPAGMRLPEFLGFALALLLLFAVDTGDRERRRAPSPDTAKRGVVASAAGIAAVTLVVTLAIAPTIPEPSRMTPGGIGNGSSIDASLSLGENLRQPSPIEVLQVRSDSTSPPYLRAVTLSSFDGSVWEPDVGDVQPLSAEAFGPLQVDEDINVVESTTRVQVIDYVSPWLPIPYPAVEVGGLEGQWDVLSQNRTVLSADGSPQGQDYEIRSRVPRPTLEQIRARSAVSPTEGPDVVSLSGSPELIDEIRAVAEEVTGGERTDYDRLFDLQSWFRTTFRYSLQTPVEDGFDGEGLDAVAAFLDVKAGYCVHFASAFAVMARTLGMPSRIVVGYLPGASTGEQVEDQTVYSVESTRLHAWPEVYFEGVGWIPFEPTASLGTATRFWPESNGVVDDSGTPQEPVAPSEAPSTAPSTDADAPTQAPETTAVGPQDRSEVPVPTVLVVLAVLAALATPGTMRALRRRRRITAAEWDARAGWDELQDTAIDLGIPLPLGESPRAWGQRLVREHGADADDVAIVVSAIERVSYAMPSAAALAGAGAAEATERLCTRLRASRPFALRALATVAPRSLAIRPGSAWAAGRS